MNFYWVMLWVYKQEGSQKLNKTTGFAKRGVITGTKRSCCGKKSELKVTMVVANRRARARNGCRKTQ
ncbi:hypothetical protein Mgra_00001182 [Meloidogyne graminicola]|uniref:Uncharacterized protein n=1 Tax=Meloidogyne graminicola TaxID=189291 RepID=A0A8T0A0Z5_9BILA|nr:hypothetical protein Mgra_00001182 [Meloidogyne graminicola]